MVLRLAFKMKWKTVLFVAKVEFQLAMALLENGAEVSIQNENSMRILCKTTVDYFSSHYPPHVDIFLTRPGHHFLFVEGLNFFSSGKQMQVVVISFGCS